MALKLRPKRFGPIHIRLDEAQEVSFADGEAQDNAFPPRSTPVATLLASVGHCLVESMRIIAKRDAFDLSPFHISVSGEKAIDAPSRLQSVACVLHGWPTGEAASSEKLMLEAKAMCTVSNTLNCTVLIELAR